MAKIIKDPKKRRNVRRSVRTLREASLETLAYFRDKILGYICEAIGFCAILCGQDSG